MYFLYEFYVVCMFECISVLVEGKVEGKVQGKDESLVSCGARICCEQGLCKFMEVCLVSCGVRVCCD